MPKKCELSVCGWPARVRLTVKVSEEADGSPKSGNVTIRIGKRGQSGTEMLGVNSTGVREELVVDVGPTGQKTLGPWPWDYWKREGFTKLIAECEGNRTTYFLDRPAQAQDRTPRATSISKVQISKKVDSANPAKMVYALVWSILDQFKQPVAGSVTTIFDAVSEDVDSSAARVGVCVKNVSVEGYGVEKFYTIIPPTGEPVILTLRGPEKPADKPQPQLHSLELVPDAGRLDNGKMCYRVLLVAKGRLNGSHTDVAMVGTTGHWTCGSESGSVTTDADGTKWFNVELSDTGIFRLTMLSGVITATVDLKGPEKKTQTTAAKPDSITIVQGERIVGDQVSFLTQVEGKPCKGSVRVTVSAGFTKLVNTATGQESTTSPVVWDSGEDGILNVSVITMECHHDVVGALANDPTKTAKTKVYDL